MQAYLRRWRGRGSGLPGTSSGAGVSSSGSSGVSVGCSVSASGWEPPCIASSIKSRRSRLVVDTQFLLFDKRTDKGA